MRKTKFVAKKYFDYYLDGKVVFDSKEECEKFVDKKNKEVAHFPHTWWEGYTEIVEISDEKTCVQDNDVLTKMRRKNE